MITNTTAATAHGASAVAGAEDTTTTITANVAVTTIRARPGTTITTAITTIVLLLPCYHHD